MSGLIRIFLCLLVATAVSAAPRPAEDFAALPFLTAPQLSPSGSRLLARVNVSGEQKLAIFTIATGENQVVNPGDMDLNWYRWANDDWILAGVGNMARVDGSEWYVRRAMAIAADLSRRHLLGPTRSGQNADDLLWIDPAGSGRILLSMQTSIFAGDPNWWPSVHEVDVASNRVKRVVSPSPGVFDWYADGQGRVRMGFAMSDDGRRRRIIYRDGASGTFRTLDRADLRRGETLTEPALFLEDGKAIAYVDDDEGFSGLSLLDLASMEERDRVFGRPGYDIGSILTDPSGTSVLGVWVTEDYSRIHWLDPALAEEQKQIDASVGAATGGARARLVSASADLTKMLLHVGRPDEPGRYFFYDRSVGAMKRIAYVSPTMRGPMHPVSTIRYKARDGLEIAAVLTLPKDGPRKGLPLVVMPHGGPYARDSEEWDWWAQFVADRGYAVIQPNYRGSSGYGTKFIEAGEGEWGLAMQDDLNDAVTHLEREGLIDPGRVCIVGGSYGGYAALRGAQRDGRVWRCAVSFAGVSDLGRMRQYDARFLGSGARSDWLRRQAPDFKSVSPLHHPEEFSIPVLLVHGARDRTVPVSQSREMAARLQRAGKTVTYVEQPEGDHFLSREEDRLAFLKLLERFLAEHNPAGA